ncbi:MAG: hypothetical protein E7231_12960 [Cellulosilyticum sp.]|nr:hypothetical protein [Cellulosilyticum sp.]
MDIYNRILKVNQNHQYRSAISITMASGEVRKYTYEVLLDEADAYAQRLIASGISKGDRIVLVAENSPAWQIAFLAIMQVEATAVLIDSNLVAEDLKECIDKADARCIFASNSVKEKLGDAKNYRIPMFNLSKEGEAFPDSYNILSPFIPNTEDPMLDIAIIFFEMDQNGQAYGVMYTHEAMIKQVQIVAQENELSRNERILSVVPNSQIEGMVGCVLSAMLVGASLHYIEALDYESLNRAFKGFKPTIFSAPKGVLKQLKEKLIELLEGQRFDQTYLAHCEKARQKTKVKLGNMMFKQLLNELGGKLELIWCYGDIEEKVLQFYYALGLDILLQYGRLETNMPVLGNRDEELTLDTYGRPYPGVEIKLMNPNLQGEGEMYIKAPYGMAGYFREVEKYKNNYEEEWFKTGTIAKLVGDGYVKIIASLNEETRKLCPKAESQLIKDSTGLPNKTQSAYYWFVAWKKAAKGLYKITTSHEEYIPENRGCIIYTPLETTKGYLGLTVGYSKERFFKFGYLTEEAPKEKLKLEDEAFGKIHFSGETLDEETRNICLDQLDKGWSLIIKAPKDAINASFTDEVIELARIASVPIIPAYLEGEETVFSGKEDTPKLFNMQDYKRYELQLRYGKPIECTKENNILKRWIQERLVALMENHPEEVIEEPIDEVTKMALEILSVDESAIKIIQKPIEEKLLGGCKNHENQEVYNGMTQESGLIENKDKEEESYVGHIDLQALLASDEDIEPIEDIVKTNECYEEEITFDYDCLSHESDEQE